MSSMHKEKAAIIKFGGSATTNENGINEAYFNRFFRETLNPLISMYSHVVLITGGGIRARRAQEAVANNKEKDLAGLRVTQEHAQQLGAIMRAHCIKVNDVVPRNEDEAEFTIKHLHTQMVVLGGLKVGQSTDTVAVTAAQLYQHMDFDVALLILSNIDCIFTADPKKHQDAKPIRQANIDVLIQEGVLLDDPKKFTPGMNVTIDPVAVSRIVKQRGNQRIPLWFGHGLQYQIAHEYLRFSNASNGTMLVRDQIPTEYYSSNKREK